MYHFVPPQTRGAVVARGQISRGIAALLATTALIASPAVLLPGIALIGGITGGSTPAAAETVSGDTLTLEHGIDDSHLIPSFDLGLLASQNINYGHFVKTGLGTYTITGNSRQQSGPESGPNLNVKAGHLIFRGANWDINKATNFGTVTVGAGSILRAFSGENNGVVIVETGGNFDARFLNRGTILNFGKLGSAGSFFENRGGQIHNTATGDWNSDQPNQPDQLNQPSFNNLTGSIVNDGKWRVDQLINAGKLENNGTVQANEIKNYTTINNNASGTISVGLLINERAGNFVPRDGTITNAGKITGNVEIRGGTVALVGTGSIGGAVAELVGI